MSDKIRQAPVTSKQARDYMRVFLSGASAETPDKQHRVTIPATLRALRGARPGPHGHRRRQPGGDLGCDGVADIPRRAGGGLRGNGGGGDPRTLLVLGPRLPAGRAWCTSPHQDERMGIGTRGLEDRAESWTSNASTPRSCSSARSSCSRRPSRPTAPCSSTPRSAWAATPRAFLERFPNLTVIGLDRDTDALGDRPRATRAVRRPGPVRAHRLRRHREAVRSEGFRRGAGRALRPRRLLAAARPCRARVRLLEGRAARHAHGLHARTHRGRRHRRVERGRTAPHLPATTARRSSPPATPGRSCERGPRRRSRGPAELVAIITAATPGRRAAAGPSGQAGVPGAAHRGERGAVGARSGRCPPRSTPSPSAAASSCSPTSRSRTASSSASLQAASSSTAPAGLPDGAARTPPAVPAPRAGRRAGERGRAGGEPACEAGAPARRRTSEEAVMTALPAQSAPAPRRTPAPKPERRLRPAPEPGRPREAPPRLRDHRRSAASR